jgi:hypothetical protein
VVLAVLTDSGREVVERGTTALNAGLFGDPGLPQTRVRDLTAMLTDLRAALGEDL